MLYNFATNLKVFMKMAKSKQKQPPNDFEECVQDGWVIVKKQKVTILIPPLPFFTQQSPMPIPGGSPLQPIAIQEVDDHIAPSQPDPPIPLPLPLVTTKPITTFSNPRKLMNHRGKLVNSHYKTPKPRKYCGNLVNGHMLVNTKMRALNLERKLKRAGGLNSWLVSLGLGQFVKIFRCKRVGKMQLVNLTMKKLKDMGAVAVGPRRKLMHAIDCLW
uniref:SAM domain-containing protein n=2 Tax=Lactuca sativa TaxID=4236 RepID=A0A9R1XWA9_LACSA|nr:hypothetical protein LSAT_V11C200087570 [Lactuca sativa]